MSAGRNSQRALGAVIVVMVTLLSGCASIVSGTNQVVSVETRDKSKQLSGASCQLVNDKGTYYVTTPGTVTVRRSLQDMNVKCEKDNAEPGVAAVKSSTKAMAFGNILFGGVIGAGVDIASGAAYDYPSIIQVMMGETVALPAAAPTSSPQPGKEANAAGVSETAAVVSATLVTDRPLLKEQERK